MVEAFQKYLSQLVVSRQSAVVSENSWRPTQYSISTTQYSFLLAVSGGLDSVVVTELFRCAGYKYSIAHCNFQLRGKEAEEDLNFVKTLAAKNNVPFFSVSFDTAEFCAKNKVSVQMGARQLRYDWLEKIRQQNKLDYIVTAHHADDAIETFFINLLRGTGISGLHGIKVKNENTIRPLLNFYRKNIENFAQENKLQWREDSSNTTDKYERNKIRHHLLPALAEINPNVKEAISLTIQNLGRTESILTNSIKKITHKYIRVDGERVFIHFDFFKELNPAVDFLYEAIKQYGFNYEQCKQIIERSNGQPGKVFLSDTYRIVIDRENLIIEPQILNKDNTIFEVGKDLNELFIEDYSYFFKTLENTPDFKIPKESENVALDFDKLAFPLKIRKWRNGDKFYPLGMSKPKKVSDFLIDNKVSIPDKEQVYVLVSGEDIAWLIGYRPDERFKIAKGTKNVYLCMTQKAITHE